MFISERFTKAEMNYLTTGRKALALVHSLEEVRHLILGSEHRTIVYTDHSALTSLLTGDATKGRIATWQNAVSEFYLKIVHVPERELALADGLSRLLGRARDSPLLRGQKEEEKGVKVGKFEENGKQQREEGRQGLKREVEVQLAGCFSTEIVQDEEDPVGFAERAKRVLDDKRRNQKKEEKEAEKNGERRGVRYPYDPIRDERVEGIEERMAVVEAEDYLKKIKGRKKWLEFTWDGEVVHWLLTGRMKKREPEGID